MRSVFYVPSLGSFTIIPQTTREAIYGLRLAVTRAVADPDGRVFLTPTMVGILNRLGVDQAAVWDDPVQLQSLDQLLQIWVDEDQGR